MNILTMKAIYVNNKLLPLENIPYSFSEDYSKFVSRNSYFKGTIILYQHICRLIDNSNYTDIPSN